MSLHRVIERVRGHRPPSRPVVVFDLDSTLLSTQERNLAILTEWAAQPTVPAPARDLVARLGAADMGWNVMDDLRHRGFADAEHLRALRSFWFERFFTDDYLRHDLPLPGAPEFVRDVHQAGAIVVYLTGRDEPGMGRGTRASLKANGFPLDVERTLLRLKPTFEEPDLEFKRRTTAELSAMGEVVAAFENEPVNANLFSEVFPQADVLFLETVHSPDPPPLASRIVRLKDFRR